MVLADYYSSFHSAHSHAQLFVMSSEVSKPEGPADSCSSEQLEASIREESSSSLSLSIDENSVHENCTTVHEGKTLSLGLKLRSFRRRNHNSSLELASPEDVQCAGLEPPDSLQARSRTDSVTPDRSASLPGSSSVSKSLGSSLSFSGHGLTSSSSGFFARHRNSFVNLVSKGGSKSSPGKTTPPGARTPLRTPSIARVTSHTITGARHLDSVNEDQVLCEGDVFAGSDVCSRRVGLFGVFDGHGGAGCSLHAVAAFPKHFKQSSVWEDLKGALPGDAAAVEKVLVKALEEAFTRTAQEFEAQATAADDSSGSCALVAAFCDGVIVTANAGDSKGLVYTKQGDRQAVRSTGVCVKLLCMRNCLQHVLMLRHSIVCSTSLTSWLLRTLLQLSSIALAPWPVSMHTY
jgi:Protein phosphatase 2C